MRTSIAFRKGCGLSSDEQEAVLNWAPMRHKIAERNENGFETHSVTVHDFYSRPIKGIDTILMVQTSVDFSYNGVRSTYGVNFIPDAASLLVVFNVAQSEVGRRGGDTPSPHVVLIEQARWGRNSPGSLEVPAGLLSEEESFDIANSWKGAARGALSEFNSETGGAHAVLKIHAADIQTLGPSVPMHPSMADRQSQFYVEKAVTAEEFESASKILEGRRGGIRAEGEATIVRILPLEAAYTRFVITGEAPEALVSVARYMRHFQARFAAPDA